LINVWPVCKLQFRSYTRDLSLITTDLMHTTSFSASCRISSQFVCWFTTWLAGACNSLLKTLSKFHKTLCSPTCIETFPEVSTTSHKVTWKKSRCCTCRVMSPRWSWIKLPHGWAWRTIMTLLWVLVNMYVRLHTQTAVVVFFLPRIWNEDYQFLEMIQCTKINYMWYKNTHQQYYRPEQEILLIHEVMMMMIKYTSNYYLHFYLKQFWFGKYKET
jgi:hypothetical protein